MDFNIEEFEYRVCKGRVQSYVARAKEPPQRIVKAVRTFMSRGHINTADLERMLSEVETESVLPFIGSPWNKPERKERFHVIRALLMSCVTPTSN